jgi:chromosomal replication initiator protein
VGSASNIGFYDNGGAGGETQTGNRDWQPGQAAAMGTTRGIAVDQTATLQWARIRAQLQQEVGDVEYRTWLKQMSLGSVTADEVTIYLPSRFLRDWVRSHYGERIGQLWRVECPSLKNVEIRVGAIHGAFAESVSPALAADADSHPDAPKNAFAAAPAGSSYSNVAAPPRASTWRAGGEDPSSLLDPRFSFDNFIVGKPNEFAYACARRVAERPACTGFNPLFLYGGVGLGKTHLMHAIGLELTNGPMRVNVAYMSAEKFMYRFIAAIRGQVTIEFKEQLRSVDVLMIDDLQFLIGKDSTQEEFFHTFNALIDAGKQIVVSADKSPSDLSGIEDRLRTRLGCGMVADVHATTFELRISILEAKAARAGVVVPGKVMEFLSHKITGNVRELEGALNRLIAHANLFQRPITLETTQEVLHDVLKAHDRRISIDEIQKRVAEHYNMRITDMVSARRARAVARPRQVAMYLAKQLTSRSLPEIGKRFGGRDHTTVMHAVSRVTELMEKEAAFAEDVELLRRMLES